MILGITGYKRSGKDTVGEFLETRGWKRWAFADKLREVVADVYGITPEHFIDDSLKDTVIEKFGKTPREMLITVGTSGFVQAYDKTWSDYVLNSIDSMSLKPRDHVITDVRFPHEYSEIVRRGGTVIRVEREGCVLGNDIKTAGLYDLGMSVETIRNDGSIEELHDSVLELIRWIA